MSQQHHAPEKVHVTVTYTGKHDFHETIPPSTTFGTVKVSAMKTFGLDRAAADQYVLQYDDTDVADGQPVGSLGREDVKLRLTLKHEPHKG
jgi:hypothetical protein